MAKVLLDKAPGECCWPVGWSEGRAVFCCEPIAAKSYCAAHYAASRRATPVFSQRASKELANYFGGGKARTPDVGNPGGPRDVVAVISTRLGGRA